MNQRSSGSVLLWLLRLAAPFKGWIALAVLLGSATIGSSIGLMAVSAYIIASAAFHPSIADLAVPIVGVRFFGIARGAFRYLERLVSHHVNFSLLAHLRVWFYAALEPLAPARLMAYKSGDLLGRIVGDIESLQDLYVRLLAPPLVAAVIAAGMFAFLYPFSPALSWVVIAFMLAIGLALPAGVRAATHNLNRRLVAARAMLAVQLVDTIQGMADLLALGRESDQIARLATANHDLIRLQSRMTVIAGWHDAVTGLVVHLALWTTLLVAIPLVSAAQIAPVHLPVLALAILASFEGVTALPLAFQYLDRHIEAARRLLDIVDPIAGQGVAVPDARQAPVGIHAATESTPAPVAPLARLAHAPDSHRPRTGEATLVVRNLSFRYAPGEPLALDDISFEISPGHMVAVVGPSGAGKSTLLSLLLRFWEYPSGEILVAGRDLRQWGDPVRDLFGVVSPSAHLFNTSIRENLLMARPEATDEQIRQACRLAQADAVICSLPLGYDTIVGEQGICLSGGERQRLTLARAYLRDAPILLLDEATAHLDAVTERQVLASVRTQAETRAVLMITHRLIGLEAVDEILVLGAGRVIERGTHFDLLEHRGPYRRLYELQDEVLHYSL